ncbi:MAG: DUF1194 domain-containing protein [Pseudomonadota bacterium]
MALGLALSGLLTPAPAAARECSTALVLAIDVSSSVDEREYRLQTDGLANAFRDREVIDAILRGGTSGIWVTVLYWSGYPHQDVRIRWTPLFSEAEIASFATAVENIERIYHSFPTAAGKLLETVPGLWTPDTLACGRLVVDVSGDGVTNDGPAPGPFRDSITDSGVTINGLVIKGAFPDPESHYYKEIIGGPGAFVEIAEGFEDYARAIRRKLIRELNPFVAEAPVLERGMARSVAPSLTSYQTGTDH